MRQLVDLTFALYQRTTVWDRHNCTYRLPCPDLSYCLFSQSPCSQLPQILFSGVWILGSFLRESTEQETWPAGLQASTRIWGVLATNLASLAAVTPVWGADVALAGPLAVDGAHTIHQQPIPDFPRFCCLRRRTEWNLTGAVEMKTQASTDN